MTSEINKKVASVAEALSDENGNATVHCGDKTLQLHVTGEKPLDGVKICVHEDQTVSVHIPPKPILQTPFPLPWTERKRKLKLQGTFWKYKT